MPDETLLILVDEVRGKTLRALQSVTEMQARWAPAGLQNSILWHAGPSYILAEWLAMRRMGLAPQIPAGWFEMFSWESRPALVPEDRWPLPDEVVARLVEQHRRLRQAIAGRTEEQLASRPADNPDRTVLSSIVHALHDEACHRGEILLLRKLLGQVRPAQGSAGAHPTTGPSR
jgi:hypothetical protein